MPIALTLAPFGTKLLELPVQFLIGSPGTLFSAQEWSEAALWIKIKWKYYVSQKQNGFNNKIHWYSILLTFIYKLTEGLLCTKIYLWHTDNSISP